VKNAGWVNAVGVAVERVQPGNAAILHPLVTCGFCRAGDEVHCEARAFPGIDIDGGMADLIRTSARSVVKLAPGIEPAAAAATSAHGSPPRS
jgi:NAD+-dependent secondary alcohol dehydrogenase Adh1